MGVQDPPVFDGHNDVLLRLWSGGADGVEERFRAADGGHLSLEQARVGGFAGGLFAIFVPSPEGLDFAAFLQEGYDIPLPDPVAQDGALRVATEQAAILHRLDRAGLLSLCRTAAEIDAAMGAGRLAAVMHMEGAEAIDADLLALDTLHAAGLRSLGPVWSRPTIFGHGVPLRFPSGPDTGPGMTEAGRRLVARCAELRIIVDLSHLNMAGFEDVADAGLPLVASHSNTHALSPGARNLTDDQLRAIGQTGGIVGLNFGTIFLREDGRADPAGGMEAAMRHLDRMVSLAGDDHVGLGSDFDGAPMPEGLGSAADLPNLRRAMRDHGFGEPLIEKICNANWRRLLRRVWGN
ncbi:dipeptidase [Oceanomicrobium pacificus]|uniref:Peptidase M19 n=1 Tax=Oceanomicrobium pacificus TaxID=2692916 RepID=A0A6B0U104_9RHOB|nr:dipeptidase [Oceanomicrobium pacificus]MXU64801.1 peptidase M19 [Oceanomicrobium pacificus]